MPTDKKLIDPAIVEVITLQDTDILYLVRDASSLSPKDCKANFDNISKGVKSKITGGIVNEAPAGSIDGSNPTFTLSQTPSAGTLMVFKNGLLQNISPSGDLTVNGSILTFGLAAVPTPGDSLQAVYQTA
jgi:hypothetical protein